MGHADVEILRLRRAGGAHAGRIRHRRGRIGVQMSDVDVGKRRAVEAQEAPAGRETILDDAERPLFVARACVGG